jgi:uncharacterized membrane protein YdjX (TVP38/TMEM64 family)
LAVIPLVLAVGKWESRGNNGGDDHERVRWHPLGSNQSKGGNKMKTVRILTLLALAGVFFIYRNSIFDYLRIISDQKDVTAYLQGFGALGPAMLCFLLIAQVFVAVIPGHALIVTAGYVYGTIGFCVVVASTVLGSQIAFFISRRYGRGLIYKLASQQTIDRWDRIARYQGTLFYFFTFVLPIFPSDLMCYVAGLATISTRRFFIANLLGRTCCAAFLTLIGIYGFNPPLWFWVLALSCVTVFYGGLLFYKKRNALSW